MSQTSLKVKMLEAFRKRMLIFIICVSSAFAILALQLVNLQLIHGKEYSLRATMNMENNIPIPAPRGEIYDRHFVKGVSGTVIVSNRPSFNLTTIPEHFKSDPELKEVLTRLSRVVEINPEDVFDEIKSSNPWERFLLKDDVTFDVVEKVASHKNSFPNIHWEDAPVRVYNYGEMFAHAVGYTGSLNKDEYNSLKAQGYKYYQSIGKAGIEKQYDKLLRGEDGFIRRVVDVNNRTENEEVGQTPFSGNNIAMTIDYEIQQAAFNALGENYGTVIVLKPSTGEIIALISKPGFDPNAIISKDNSQIIKDLNADPKKTIFKQIYSIKISPGFNI